MQFVEEFEFSYKNIKVLKIYVVESGVVITELRLPAKVKWPI